jgi:hypothetical protein
VPNRLLLIPLALALALALAAACRRQPAGRGSDPGPAPAASAARASLLAGVVNPWSWPRARGATDRELAIEDIGPYEPADRAVPGSPLVNTNGHYWTTVVRLAWDRDVNIRFDKEPVDLDGDGVPDTRLTRVVEAKGGILANPALFGLIPTPDDPRGRIGRISASTGVLGLREALDSEGRRTGQIGMTCFLCHGGENPETGETVLGLPGTRFDYGLLLATSALLDDGDQEAAAYRAARRFPPGRAVQARLLLSGPGRQDLTGEFGLDITVPALHSSHYPGTKRVRQGTRGITNPVSVPGVLAAPGLLLQNWSGSENSAAPTLERLIALAGQPEAQTLAAFGLTASDRAWSRRSLLLDLRNLGTLGLQQDSFAGLLWADALYGHVTLSAAELAAIPPLYAAQPVRRTLAASAAAIRRPLLDPAAVSRGLQIFASRVVGEIANRQILKQVPAPYASARLSPPILAPIDPTRPLDARLPVRCADCHSGTPGESRVSLATNPPPLGRCTHCHLIHPERPPAGGAAGGGGEQKMISIAKAFPALPTLASAEVSTCGGCHDDHRAFGPLVHSSSRLFPFDADGDGNAQGDQADDAAAGGIGTEPLLAFDVPVPDRPGGRFGLDVPLIRDPRRPGPVTPARIGVAWVRAAPLLAVFATAPYLHNGSVPTLRALLDPPSRRPISFRLGQAGFVLDTRVPGNRNVGHQFGISLSPREKDDVVAYLRSL